MAKEKKIEFPNPNFQLYERVDDEKHIDLKNGDVRYYPDSNKERLFVCMDVEIQPGEYLAIDAGYTIEGKIMSRDTDDEDNNENEN